MTVYSLLKISKGPEVTSRAPSIINMNRIYMDFLYSVLGTTENGCQRTISFVHLEPLKNTHLDLRCRLCCDIVPRKQMQCRSGDLENSSNSLICINLWDSAGTSLRKISTLNANLGDHYLYLIMSPFNTDINYIDNFHFTCGPTGLDTISD